MNNGSENILARLKDVPALPMGSARVLQRLQAPDADIQEVARLIEFEAGLTANILRLANSSYYGCSRTIGSVREAIVRLGTQKIFELIISVSVAPMIQQPLKGYDLPAGDLWIHSAAVAIAARELQATLGIIAPDYVFTAALLHDVGKIVLGNFVATNAASISGLVAAENLSFETAEHRVLGVDHAEVGATLLEMWNLPPAIAEIVRWHHHPESFPGDPLAVDIVHVADVLCVNCGIGTGLDGLSYRPAECSASRLGITVHTSETVVSKLLGGIDEIKNLFMPGNRR